MVRMVNSFMCILPQFQEIRNLKKNHTHKKPDVVFLPFILIYIIILPYCWYHSCISSREDLSLLADREWLDIGRFEAKQELMGRNELGQGKTLGFPQRAQERTLNGQQDCEDQKHVATEMGEGLTNRLGHKSLKVNPRVGLGFQKADKALPGAEILSQHPPFPFLPISPHCC